MKLYEITIKMLEASKFTIKKKTHLYYLNATEYYIRPNFDFCTTQITSEKINCSFKSFMERYSTSVAKCVKGLINRSLAYAFERGYLSERIAITCTIINKQSAKIYGFSKREQQKIEDYIYQKGNLYYYGILISLYTGLRLGELLALKWSDIDFTNKVLRINNTTCKCIENHKQIEIVNSPKTLSSIREIPIPPHLKKILRELKSQNSDYVLSNRKGCKVDYRTYQSCFERLLNRVGIAHRGFHSLRHTFATRLLELGVDVKTISELLGHSNPKITLERYVHTDMENKMNAMKKLTKKPTKIVGKTHI